MGSAELACASLQALVDAEFCDVIAVVSQPDKRKGRDMKSQPTPVGELAVKTGLEIHKPGRARDAEFMETIQRLNPDLVVVVAYGQILPQALLDIPKFGCLNVHTSILPKYRGAAPIQWALVDGEPETGVTIMKMDAGLDTGDIVSEARTPIFPEDNGQVLHDRLAKMGAKLLVETIPGFLSGLILPRPQPGEGSTYARKISKHDGLIDWSRSAVAIFNQVRGFTPWPGAFTYLPGDKNPKLLKIWKVEKGAHSSGGAGTVMSVAGDELLIGCGDGALRILELQKEGSRRMNAKEFLQGSAIFPGQQLG
jgi:methionyl-tRNA formyltransferase